MARRRLFSLSLSVSLTHLSRSPGLGGLDLPDCSRSPPSQLNSQRSTLAWPSWRDPALFSSSVRLDLALHSTACTATVYSTPPPMPDHIGGRSYPPGAASIIASASYPDHALSLQSPACALDYRLLSCPQARAALAGDFPPHTYHTHLTTPRPLPIDWLLCCCGHAALTTTHAHVQ